MQLFGETLSKADVYRRVGDLSQIGGVRQYEFQGGKAKGVGAVEVDTGGGLRFVLLQDRCLDIPWASFNGVPLGFLSKAGVSSSLYYEHRGEELHRVFAPGLLTTCGLRNIGRFCQVDGEEFAQHGRIANAPGENLSISGEWQGDEYHILVSAWMREAVLYAENLWLHRTVETRLGDCRFVVTDRIVNRAFRQEPFSIAYHINFSYPLLNEEATAQLPEGALVDTGTGELPPRWEPSLGKIPPPQDNRPRQPGYRLLFDGNQVEARLLNPKLKGFQGIYLRYDKECLPCFTMWRNFASGDYVVGFEPGTAFPQGRDNNLRDGLMKVLEPMEEYRIQWEFGMIF